MTISSVDYPCVTEAEGLWQRIVSSLKLVWSIIGGILDYITGVLNSLSREHRIVARILDEEKDQYKAQLRVRSCGLLVLWSLGLMVSPSESRA